MNLRFFFTLILSLLAMSSHGDPIQDYSMQSYKAGWFPNFYQQDGPMTCPQTCEVWTKGTGVAESELSYELAPEYKRTHVCKISNNEKAIYYGQSDPKAHWLYGNQFDDKPVCFSGLPEKTKASELFMCLCVSRCQLADLIVRKIHNPVWDASNNRSVIQVTVSNIGTQMATTSYLRLTDTGNGHWTTAATPSIAAGASVTITLYLNGYWVFDPNAELKAEADYKHDVEECNENNNALEYFKMG